MEPGGEALELLRHPSGLPKRGQLVLLSALAPASIPAEIEGCEKKIARGYLAAEGRGNRRIGNDAKPRERGMGVHGGSGSGLGSIAKTGAVALGVGAAIAGGVLAGQRALSARRSGEGEEAHQDDRRLGSDSITGERSADVADGCATQRAGDDDVAEDDWGAQGDERAPHGASRIEEDISSSLMSVVFREAGIAAAVAGAQAAARVFADQRSGKPRPASEEQSARHA